jgi:Ca2+-transporting ATPase
VRSLAYFSLVTTNVALIFANRSFSASIWTAVARRNPSLWVGLVAIAGVLAVVSTWPPVQRLFRLGTPHWDDLAACLGTGVGLLMVLELLKPAFRPRAAPARLAD